MVYHGLMNASRPRRAVLIVCDGLGAEWVSETHTPTLARLLEGHRRANDHRAVFPSVTRVSAASIATGCFPGRHGLEGNQMALVEAGLLVQSAGTTSLSAMALLLLVFFCGFNALEATQPSLASRIAPRVMRGTAMGVYNTLQSLGFFVGGLMGGWLVKTWGSPVLFLSCGLALLVWLWVAWPMQTPGRGAPLGQTA